MTKYEYLGFLEQKKVIILIMKHLVTLSSCLWNMVMTMTTKIIIERNESKERCSVVLSIIQPKTFMKTLQLFVVRYEVKLTVDAKEQ